MTYHRCIASLGLVVLLVLHLAFWRTDEVELYAGWLPSELGYRVLWIALCWAYLIYFCRYLWPGPAGPHRAASESADGESSGERPGPVAADDDQEARL